jgi:hypothetical protein
MRLKLAAAFLALVSVETAAAAGQPSDDPWAEVMLLGTVHLANPGLDTFNAEVDDVLAPGRQREIEAVAKALVRFKPDVVMIEWPMEDQDELSEEYRQYQAGERADVRNETHQLGLRIAHMAGNKMVYAIDESYAFMSEEQSSLDPSEDERLQTIFAGLQSEGENFVSWVNEALTNETVGSILHDLNTEEMLGKNSGFYHGYMMRAWQGDNPGGAMTVANWYTRNILIYQNMLRVIEDRAEEQDEPLRVLVVYGQAHVPPFAEMIEASPYLEEQSPLRYLRRFRGDKRRTQ